MKEKTDSQQWQLKCRTYQQRAEQLQKSYQVAKEKYKQRLHEERLDLFLSLLNHFYFILLEIYSNVLKINT